MAVALTVFGVVLLVLTFLLAFTIYGMISAVLGLACLAYGTVLLGRRPPRPPRARRDGR